MTKIEKTELRKIKNVIDNNCDFIEVQPKSKFIVSSGLGIVAKRFGPDIYNRTVIEFGLDNLGYKFL